MRAAYIDAFQVEDVLNNNEVLRSFPMRNRKGFINDLTQQTTYSFKVK